MAVWGLGDRWLFLTDGWEGTRDSFTPAAKGVVHLVLAIPALLARPWRGE